MSYTRMSDSLKQGFGYGVQMSQKSLDREAAAKASKIESERDIRDFNAAEKQRAITNKLNQDKLNQDSTQYDQSQDYKAKQDKIANNLAILADKRAQDKTNIEKQKADQAANAAKLKNAANNFDKLLKNMNNIPTPEGKANFFNNITSMDFFKNSTPEFQEVMTTVGDATIAGNTNKQKAFQELVQSMDKDNKDTQMMNYFKFATMMGEDPSPGIKTALETIGNIMGFNKKAPTPTTVSKLMTERDNLPIDSQDRSAYEDAISKQTKHPKYVDSDIESSTKSKLEKEAFNLKNTTEKLKLLRQELLDNPALLEAMTLGGVGMLKGIKVELWRKLGIDPDASDVEKADAYTDFVTRYAQTIGKTIHDLWGKTLTKNELLERNKAFPNFADPKKMSEWWSSDSGKRFATKLDATILESEKSIARYNMALDGGEIIRNKAGEIIGFYDKDGNELKLNDMPTPEQEKANKAADISKQLLQANPELQNDPEKLKTLVMEALNE